MGIRQKAQPENQQEADEIRIARALSHPLRVRILTELNRRDASPSEISLAWGKEVAGIAYHCRVLEKAGMVEVVKSEPIRGSVKHTFRAVQRMYYSTDAWEAIPKSARSDFSALALDALGGRASHAVSAGTFDSRTDRHLNVSTFEVDEVGWQRIHDLLDGVERAMLEVEEETRNRAADDAEVTHFWATVGLLSFESPGPE